MVKFKVGDDMNYKLVQKDYIYFLNQTNPIYSLIFKGELKTIRKAIILTDYRILSGRTS